MIAKDAIEIFQSSQRNIHRKRTKDSYRYLLEHLEKQFTDSHIEGIYCVYEHRVYKCLR